MVFLYLPWKELEPEEGRYAFDRWERLAWSAPEAVGKHVVFRVYVDYPSKPSGLPDWLKRLIAGLNGFPFFMIFSLAIHRLPGDN